MPAYNPFNQNQTQSWATPGTSVPKGWTTNAAAPTPEAYQFNANARDYNPINLTSGLFEGVGEGRPFFYQSKTNPGLYSTRKDEVSLGGDMYASLNPEWAKSIGGREGGLGWEFDFDPTSQLYGNPNALIGRKVGNQNSLKAVGGELLRMATIPAMAFGVAGLQGAGVLPGASGGLQPITGAAAPGAAGAASTGVGAGAGAGSAAGSGVGYGAGTGLTAAAPASGYTVGGSVGSGLGLTAGSGGTATGLGLSGAGAAGSAAAAGAGITPAAFSTAGTGGGWLSSILGGVKSGLGAIGNAAAANPISTGLGLGQGILQYLQGQDLMDIAREAAAKGNALDQPQRQQYQQLLSQYMNGGQDITNQPAIKAALDRAGAENQAQLARMGMTGSGRALTSVADYTSDVFNKNAMPYLQYLAGLGGFDQGPGYSGNLYGQLASQATGANTQALGSIVNGITNPSPYQQPWWWHAMNAQNQMTQVPGAGTYMRPV